MAWQIDECIDVEAAIAADNRHLAESGGERAALDGRDRRIVAAIQRDTVPEDEQGWLQAWIRQRRLLDDDLPGQAVRHRWRLVQIVGGLLALFAGAGLAAVLLRYDGREPINLLHVLGGLVVLPGLLLLVALLLQLPLIHRHLARLGGPLPGLVAAAIGPWLLRAQRQPGLLPGLLRQRAGRPLYGDVGRWQVVTAVQGWGLAFLIGALAATIWLGLVSDLAFCWHSTLLDEAAMTDLVAGLSAPWAWVAPGAAPDADLVAQSRYVLLEGRFVAALPGERALDADILHRWWPFVVASLAVWALLPRLLAWLWCRRRSAKALGQLHLDHDDHRRIVARLGQQGAAGFTPRGPVDAPPVTGDPIDTAASALAPRLHLVRWLGDESLQQRAETELAGHDLLSRHVVGADVDLSADRAAVAAVAADPAAVLVVVDAREPPLAEVLVLLRELGAAGDGLTVALSGPADDRLIWREALAEAGLALAVQEWL